MNYYSGRGFPLFVPPNAKLPLLTVELHVKWYGFQLTREDGIVEEIPFPSNTGDWRVLNHTPHQDYYADIAESMNVNFYELIEELIAGRRVIEENAS